VTLGHLGRPARTGGFWYSADIMWSGRAGVAARRGWPPEKRRPDLITQSIKAIQKSENEKPTDVPELRNQSILKIEMMVLDRAV
jgi:hypothetical protein